MPDEPGRDAAGPGEGGPGEGGPGERGRTADPAGAGVPPDGHADDGLELARLIASRITASLSAAGGAPRRSARGPGRVRRPPGGRVSGAHPDERDPQALAGSVRRLVDDRGWDQDLRVHGVFGRWREVVGPGIADHCTPESFAQGRLVVRTDSTAWATQLRLLAGDVVRRLNEELGDGTVTFVDVQGPAAPSWRKGRLRVRGRGPRDTYG